MTKYILILIFSILSSSCVLNFPEEGATDRVNITGWSELERGMTKDQVITLIGETASKHGVSSTEFDDGLKLETQEHWEYNFTKGLTLFGQVHDDAYVVYFDQDGLLDSWRKPKK